MTGNKVYNVLKALALTILPAAGTLYFTLAGIWSLPAAEQVVGSIVAVDTFLGVIVTVMSVKYKEPTDGTIVVNNSVPGKTAYQLQLDDFPDNLEGKTRVVMAVQPGRHIKV